MKMYVQWATAVATEWVEIDSADWATLPAKDEPQGGELRDSAPGWVNMINVQGVRISGDHLAVEDVGEAVRVSQWNDDPQDRPSSEFVGKVWTFQPVQPDAAIGGRMNTRIGFDVFCGAGLRGGWEANLSRQLQSVNRWSQFAPPDAALTRHGIWMPDRDFELHRWMSDRTQIGWHDWRPAEPPRIAGGAGVRTFPRDTDDAACALTFWPTLDDFWDLNTVQGTSATLQSPTTSNEVAPGDPVLGFKYDPIDEEVGDHDMSCDVSAIDADSGTPTAGVSLVGTDIARTSFDRRTQPSPTAPSPTRPRPRAPGSRLPTSAPRRWATSWPRTCTRSSMGTGPSPTTEL